MWPGAKQNSSRTITQGEFEREGFTHHRNDQDRKTLYNSYKKGKAINDNEVASSKEALNNIWKNDIPINECVAHNISTRKSKKNDAITTYLKQRGYGDKEINDFLINYEIKCGKNLDIIFAKVDLACKSIQTSLGGGTVSENGYVELNGVKHVPIVTFKEDRLNATLEACGEDSIYYIFSDDVVDNATVTISKMLKSNIRFGSL